ncbi:uncharacterized protein [Onthophagus taurus]|uniref:uncharacterized protein isoform X2 n=1 Tax=Onthophagus taurus TaxID=166361 RepID=UPI000C20C5B7|nr:uncharacterized protein LOC111420199 isoform X2 [Onthophagus taurus]
MNRFVLLFWLAFCVPKINGEPHLPTVLPCSDGFVKIHNFCYYFSVEAENFDGAEFKCRERKSNLAVIHNKRQDRELKNYLIKQYAASVPRWLGGQYNWIKKQWVWRLNGKLIKYQSFLPNNNASSEWNCLLSHPSYNFNWIGSKCWEKQYFICQTHLLHPQLKNATHKNQPGYYIVTPSPPKKAKPKISIVCPRDFQPIGRKCFSFSTEKETWQQAYHKCEDKRSQLAIFRKPGQNRKLKLHARKLRLFEDVWLGGRYDWNRKNWKWAKNGKIIQGRTPQKDQDWTCLTWSYNLDTYGAENCLTTQYYLCQTQPDIIQKKKEKKIKKVEFRFELYNKTDSTRHYD